MTSKTTFDRLVSLISEQLPEIESGRGRYLRAYSIAESVIKKWDMKPIKRNKDLHPGVYSGPPDVSK